MSGQQREQTTLEELTSETDFWEILWALGSESMMGKKIMGATQQMLKVADWEANQ